MTKDSHTALIVARAGRLRESLNAIVAALPQIEETNVAGSGRSALEMVSKLHPGVVLADANTPGVAMPGFVGLVKARWAQAGCILIVGRPEQRSVAEASGADVVLVRGFKTPELFSAIETLLPSSR